MASESTIIVPDTSVLVDGRITKLLMKEEYRNCRVIVSEVVVAELEHQANMGRESGFKGLEELKMLRGLRDEKIIYMEFTGARPHPTRFEDNDNAIRAVAEERGGTLVTSDFVQAEVAEGKGIDVMYMGHKKLKRDPGILDYFDESTMSIHLKEKVVPLAKKGVPGSVTLVRLSEELLEGSYIEKLAQEIIEFARIDPDSFIEIERKGAAVIQMGNVRVAIARPPFSDGYEITAVRPVAEVGLDDYRLSEKLMERLGERAEGILVAGPPGAGKSTFSQALAEFYNAKDHIVKTMETPRDLMVSDEITQYAALEGDMEKTADILLLVRPDYTIYDELRKTRDFEIFADMRLAGVGMVGVVHASKAIDAVQRFIGRVELGMIPQVVDTVVYVKDGKVMKVYSLSFTVKVPMGMYESDLARPVIEVQDFETANVEYEIYTFGDETVVMPAMGEDRNEPMEQLAAERVAQRIKRSVPKAYMEVEMEGNKAVVWLEDKFIPKLIGRKGKTVEALQKELKVKIDVRSILDKQGEREKVEFSVREAGRYVTLLFEKRHVGDLLEIYANDNFLFSATVSRKGEIKVQRASETGQAVLEARFGGGTLYAIKV